MKRNDLKAHARLYGIRLRGFRPPLLAQADPRSPSAPTNWKHRPSEADRGGAWRQDHDLHGLRPTWDRHHLRNSRLVASAIQSSLPSPNGGSPQPTGLRRHHLRSPPTKEKNLKIVQPSIELLAITPNSAQLIEAAGRTCYKSEDKITDDSADKFVQMIRKRGHESVIEHAYATFRIITDRGITHEIVRHRLASYSQESTRYCNYGKEKFGEEITVILPSGMTQSQYKAWEFAMQICEGQYFEMLERGAKPQQARSVLPTCLKTEIVMTANFREWCHFIRLRAAKTAHPDIQPLAMDIGGELSRHCPPVFADLEVNR